MIFSSNSLDVFIDKIRSGGDLANGFATGIDNLIEAIKNCFGIGGNGKDFVGNDVDFGF